MSRIYSPAERRRRARLIVQGGRHALAGADTARFDRQIDRIEQAAEDRWRREGDAAARLVEAARQEVAGAKARERAAARKERGPLTVARKRAEQAVRRAEQATRRYQR